MLSFKFLYVAAYYKTKAFQLAQQPYNRPNNYLTKCFEQVFIVYVK